MDVSGKNNRIEVIDVLRGFTLLGIAIVHFAEQYYAGQPPESKGDFLNHSLTDQIVSGFIQVLISGKFFMIFSFLFGLSFFIQLDRSDFGAGFLLRFSWRLILLFLIGLIHSLHYRGDILTIYAVLGVILLLCFRLPDKALLILALLLVLNVPSIIVRTIGVISPAEGSGTFGNNNQEALELYYNTVKSGTYFEILRANFFEIKSKFEFQVEFGRLYITTGLFLLGLYAGRKNVFQNITLFKNLTKRGLWTMLACVIIALTIFAGAHALKIELTQQIGFLVGGGLADIFNAALATVYVAVIVRMFQNDKWKNRLMIFYAVGRMGLTTYLTQTLIGVLLFFSFGLHLLGEIGSALCSAIAITLFVVQIVLSRIWLRHFHYGPVEWLWRSLTYFKLQPFRKK